MKHKPSSTLGVAAAALLVMVTPNANAAMLELSGTFAASGSGGTPGVPSLSGSWSMLFDDSVVTGVGFEIFVPLPLTSLTLNPNPLGVTMFDTGNSSAVLEFFNGVLSGVGVGGSIGGPAGLLSSNDDWAAVYGASQNLSSVTGTVASEASLFAFFNADSDQFEGGMTIREVQPPSVPEPSSVLASLLALGVLGIPGVRALRRRA